MQPVTARSISAAATVRVKSRSLVAPLLGMTGEVAALRGMTGNVIPSVARNLLFAGAPSRSLVAALLGMTGEVAALLGMTGCLITGARSRGLVRQRPLLQHTRGIALDTLTEPRNVVGRRAEIAHHLIEAALLRQRIAEVGEQNMNLMERLDRF